MVLIPTPQGNQRSAAGGSNLQLEPFVMGDSVEGSRSKHNLASSNPSSSPETTTIASPSSSSQPQGAVYVLHHDSNAPPVTIYHEVGQQIVELPPRYPENDSRFSEISPTASLSELRSHRPSPTEGTAISPSTPSSPLPQQQRRPTPVRKPSRESTRHVRPQGPR